MRGNISLLFSDNCKAFFSLLFLETGSGDGRRPSRDYDAFSRDISPSRYDDSPSHRYGQQRPPSPERRPEFDNSPPRRQYDSPYHSPSPPPRYENSPPARYEKSPPARYEKSPQPRYEKSSPPYPAQRPFDDSDDSDDNDDATMDRPTNPSQGSPRSGPSKGTKRKRDHDGRERLSPVDRDRRGSSRERQKKKSKKSDAPCKYWLEGICDKVRFPAACTSSVVCSQYLIWCLR